MTQIEATQGTKQITPKSSRALPPRHPKPTEAQSQELAEIFCARWYSVADLRALEVSTGKRFKRGKWSKTEKERLKQSLEEALLARNSNIEEFVEILFDRKTGSRQTYEDTRYAGLFKEIALKMRGRPILLTYQCLRRLYHPGNHNGPWTASEDAQLHQLFALYGPDWETIGKHIGRYGMSCRDRYRAGRGRLSSGPWSEQEVDRLLKAVAALTTDAHSKDTQAEPNRRPSWILVSEAVATRSVGQCLIKWTSLQTVARNHGRRPTWTPSLDHHLLSCLYELAIVDVTEVDWRSLSEHEGWRVYFNGSQLKMRVERLMKRVPFGVRASGLDESLEYLLMHCRPLSDDTISSSSSSSSDEEEDQ